MYEFRDLNAYAKAEEKVYDTRMVPTDDEGNKINLLIVQSQIMTDYVQSSTGKTSYFQNVNSHGYDARKRAQYDADGNGIIDNRKLTTSTVRIHVKSLAKGLGVSVDDIKAMFN